MPNPANLFPVQICRLLIDKVAMTLFFLGFICMVGYSQNQVYSVANAHSHNDYENRFPLTTAYDEQFGSIEADIFLCHDSLIVGHTTNDIQFKRTLEAYYLDPLQKKTMGNNGFPYKDSARSLQLLIDVKTEAIPTINRLKEILIHYPLLIHSAQISFVITGNRPAKSTFSSYPSFIMFDGDLKEEYTPSELMKIPMFSDDLKVYTKWNGKGRIPKPDMVLVNSYIQKAHGLGKKIRFWDSPDFTNAWYQLIHLGVDYINTDKIVELSSYLKNLALNTYTSPSVYGTYKPTYRTDGIQKTVKNVILLIGDGCGWPQLYAGYTANHASLNIFNMKNIGLSKTSSYDSYVTDSAPGATAISSGIKTNNRSVGVDHTGTAVPLIPVYLKKRNIKTGLVTCGDITDATPADFYAHQKERDSSIAVFRDLKSSPITILMGSGNESLANVRLLDEEGRQRLDNNVLKELESGFNIVNNIGAVTNDTSKKWVVIDRQAGLSYLNGRGDWLQRAFSKSLSVLANNRDGFFIMTEGAQIDYGGHANSLPYVVTEVADFDKVVGEALKFADTNGETLVIVTADHETGGLTLLDGDYTKGYISGKFSTNDHTALPVPVFAYGPMSGLFTGVYENTELFNKILEALNIVIK